MTYHVIMSALVQAGYVHDWKFGDRVYCPCDEPTIMPVKTDSLDGIVEKDFNWEPEGIMYVRLKSGQRLLYHSGKVPVHLPQLHQWYDLFRAKGWELSVSDENGCYVVQVVDIERDVCDGECCSHEGLLPACAELYARVVLGLKWDGKEFV